MKLFYETIYYGTLDDLVPRDRDRQVDNVLLLTYPASQFLLYAFEWPFRWWERLLFRLASGLFGTTALVPGEIKARQGSIRLEPVFFALVESADVLLHDCYMPDDEPELARRIGYSHATPVAQLADEAGVGRLVLIHLNALRPEASEPDLDRAQSILPNTKLAFDGMQIEF